MTRSDPQNQPSHPEPTFSDTSHSGTDQSGTNQSGAGQTGRRSRTQRWLHWLRTSQHALALLFVASLLETIIVPIPIEVVLIPFMLLNRNRIWLIAGVATAGCLAGAIIGYAVGYLLFDAIGPWLLEAMSMQQAFQSFQTMFHEHGFWAVLIVGVTPIPFQVAMLTAGIAGYPIVQFVVAALIARGIRYFGLAVLVALFGHRAIVLWKRYGPAAAVASLVLIGVVFLVFRLIAGTGGP